MENSVRKEIKDHESSKMHSNNRFSVCEGNKLKKWKNSGLERWFWYYKRREEPYCRMQ